MLEPGENATSNRVLGGEATISTTSFLSKETTACREEAFRRRSREKSMDAIFGFLDAARADDLKYKKKDGTSKARWAKVIAANPNGDPVSRYISPYPILPAYSHISTSSEVEDPPLLQREDQPLPIYAEETESMHREKESRPSGSKPVLLPQPWLRHWRSCCVFVNSHYTIANNYPPHELLLLSAALTLTA